MQGKKLKAYLTGVFIRIRTVQKYNGTTAQRHTLSTEALAKVERHTLSTDALAKVERHNVNTASSTYLIFNLI